MKVARVRYNVPLGPMIQDLQRVFSNQVVNAANLQAAGGILMWPEKKRFAYVKEKFDANGNRIAAVVYALVRNSFVMPNWIQGTVLNPLDVNNPIDHYFMGHEVDTEDDPNDEPEEEII